MFAAIEPYILWIKIGAAVVLVVGYTIFVCNFWGGHVSEKYETAIAKQKAEAARMLLAKTNDVIAHEAENTNLLQELEGKDNELDALRGDTEKRVRAAVAGAGGLRDPGYRKGSDCPGQVTAPGPDSGDSTDTGGKLSGIATEFLFDQARKALVLRDRLTVCRAYALEVEAFRAKQQVENTQITP